MQVIDPFRQCGPNKKCRETGCFKTGIKTKAGAENVANKRFPAAIKFSLHFFVRHLHRFARTIRSRFLFQFRFGFLFCELTMPTVVGPSLSSYKHVVPAGAEKSESTESVTYETPRKRKLRSDSAADVNLLSGNSVSTPKKWKSNRRIAASNPRMSEKVNC